MQTCTYIYIHVCTYGEHDINLHTFTLTNPLINTKERLASSALMIYAVYNVFNTLNQEPTQLSAAEVYNALTQQIREAVKGHPTSMDIIKQLWTTNAVTPLPPLSSQRFGSEGPTTQTGRNQTHRSSSSVPARPRSLRSLPHIQSHGQPQFQSGGFLDTTSNIRSRSQDNKSWTEQ